jgi:serine/threonine protein kinase
MKDELPPTECPDCGVPIPDGAPLGLCPRCLLAEVAMETDPSPMRHQPGPAFTLGAIAEAFPSLDILEPIGSGGMGCVYKVRQKRLDRLVALKLLRCAPEDEEAFAGRFLREARALARLNHPNIVTIYEFGEAGGFYYLLMEYVDGVNLRQAMAHGRLSPQEALKIVPMICEALQYAHEQGVLHRDIKPANILLEKNGGVKVADFGLAKFVDDRGRGGPELTLTEASLGTPAYMAPEQTIVQTSSRWG